MAKTALRAHFLIPASVVRSLRRCGGMGWLGFWGLAFVLGMPRVATPADAARSPELRVTEMTYVASREARNLYWVQAEESRVNPATEVATLNGVHVSMSPGSGPSFEFHCARGEIQLATGDFRAEGRVRGVTGDGRRFSTEWVRYDNVKRTVSTTAAVLIEDAAGQYRGKKGFRYFVDREQLELFEPEVVFGP